MPNPPVSVEELIIAIVRVLGSLPVLRWAFVGGIIAVLVDLSDLFLMNLLRLGGVSNYQAFDKWLDQVYLICFLVVALRWPDPARSVAVALYGLRLAGFVAFEVTGEREVLVAFPNLFEFWFLFVASLPHWRPARGSGAGVGGASRSLPTSFQFTTKNLAISLGVLLVAKEAQEVVIHWLKLLDSFTAVEAVEAVWDWLKSVPP